MMNAQNRRTAALLPLLLMAGFASAQQSVIDHCRKTSSDADRIACLEAALLGRDADVPAPPDAPAVEEAAPQAAAPAAAEPAEPPKPKPEPTTGLRVATFATVSQDRLQVTLENGEVWQQIKGDTQRIRIDAERNPTVDISRTFLGGHKLRLNEMGRTIRVERVQ